MSNYAESHFLKLQDYIAEGSKGELSAEERDYENLLFSTCGLIRKEGRDAAREWLMNDRHCSRYVADRVVSESINLFFATDAVKREAWRNLLFQKLLDAAVLWEHDNIKIDKETGERTCKAKAKDFEAYVKIIKQAASLKRLGHADETDSMPLTGNIINLFSTNATAVGIPATDRRAIIQNPFFQRLPKKEQQRLAMEIGEQPMDIDAIMDNSLEIAHEVIGEE